MTAAYALHFYNSSGIKQAVVTDFLSLAYSRHVNAPGAVQFSLNGEHSLLDSIQDKWEVEVWRDGASESVALFRDEEWTQDEDGNTRFNAFCPGIMGVLSWREINWVAGSTNRTKFEGVPAETIMKKLVEYNIGPNATSANGRKRDGTNASVTIQADSSGGSPISFFCHGKNLLETLQNVSKAGAGDFDLVKTGPSTYDFRFYDEHLGADKSASITFALEYGNMAEPVYRRTRSTEKTVATVWGQGEGASRDFVSRTGENYSVDNDAEVYVDARDVDKGSTSALNAKGDSALYDTRSRDSFTFKTRQTEGVQYRQDYDLGDLVKAINPFTGASTRVKAFSVVVSLDEDGNETIEAEMNTP